jgi:hypothetical protein
LVQPVLLLQLAQRWRLAQRWQPRLLVLEQSVERVGCG